MGKRHILILTFFIASIFGVFGQTEVIKAGSVVIDMGVTPQTVNNAIKPYGLVYALIKDHLTPIVWSINPNKTKDGVDFTVDGRDFRGGTFVVRQEYLTPAVQAEIAIWEAKGVVTYTTQTTLLVPMYKDLEFFANWVLDTQNGSIAQEYLDDAEIPATAYRTAVASGLDYDCDDLFILPHADPNWTDHGGPLLQFTSPGVGGWLWSGCHAVSKFEALQNPNNANERTNFLASDITPAPNTTGYALLDTGEHDDASNVKALQQQL